MKTYTLPMPIFKVTNITNKEGRIVINMVGKHNINYKFLLHSGDEMPKIGESIKVAFERTIRVS